MENTDFDFWHEKLEAMEVGTSLPVDNQSSVYSAIRRLRVATIEHNTNLPEDEHLPRKHFTVRAVSRGSKDKIVIRKK